MPASANPIDNAMSAMPDWMRNIDLYDNIEIDPVQLEGDTWETADRASPTCK